MVDAVCIQALEATSTASEPHSCYRVIHGSIVLGGVEYAGPDGSTYSPLSASDVEIDPDSMAASLREYAAQRGIDIDSLFSDASRLFEHPSVAPYSDDLSADTLSRIADEELDAIDDE